MERLMLLLEPLKEQLIKSQQPLLHCILPMTSSQHALALLLADELRAHQLSVDILFEGSLKSMMRKASKLAAAYVLIIGETEQQNRTVVLKNMINGTEESVLQIDVIEKLKK